jgi:hypothetical protein
MDKHSCPLRGLSLCDGHQLEDQAHALTSCLCDVIARQERYGRCPRSELSRAERQVLIEETLAPRLAL